MIRRRVPESDRKREFCGDPTGVPRPCSRRASGTPDSAERNDLAVYGQLLARGGQSAGGTRILAGAKKNGIPAPFQIVRVRRLASGPGAKSALGPTLPKESEIVKTS